jgi:uncharacterized protein (DUF1697 family)
MNQYVALLRGINVGGNSLIKMADLKACFEAQGFSSVITYVQSGNVLFKTAELDKAKLTKQIESALHETFHYSVKVVLLSRRQLQQIVSHAPQGFGSQPEKYHSDVIFLKEPLTAIEAMKSITLREGVDQVTAGKAVLYFSRLTAKLAQSGLSRVVGLPVYQNMTIRSWTTTTKLVKLLETSV